MITQDELKQLIHYNPDTGVFTWRHSRGRVKAGQVAGGYSLNGCKMYHSIRLNGRLYRSHRLAWLYMTGEWPGEMDHISGDGTDNRWLNLRTVDRQENSRNHRLADHNTSGVTGVHWDAATGRWRAEIGVDGHGIKLGRHDDFFEAVCVRKSAELRLGFHSNHGSIRPL